ncbi:DUF2971 domain-containing protein [Microbacterium sp. NPDC077184]|uniref:DUF2971 domain-containing protein n=1 Tax=Microbacterium sp. NPDC077184 TaxID=3154764 RepID=UPI0034148998
MTDDSASDDKDDAGDDAASKAVEAWAESSSERLRDAAVTHQGWARALEADAGLADQLAQLSELTTRALPGMKRALAEFGRISSYASVDTSAIAAALASLRVPQVDVPSLDTAAWRKLIEDVSEVGRHNSERLLPALRSMQVSLNALNSPSYARETQRFITGTDALKYRGRQRVWHYTSAHALNQILRTHVLWASSPHHLNDASELVHGVDVVRDAIERLAAGGDAPRAELLESLRSVTDREFVEAAMHEIYYISASSAPDSLTLWRNYSSTDGFAIGLRPTHSLSAEGLALSQAEPAPHSELPTVASWYRVEYNNKRKDALAGSFVRSAIRDIDGTPAVERQMVVRELRKHLLILASTMKHRAFEDEREVRWITTNWAPVDVVHFEVTGRGFVPVLHVSAEGSTVEAPFLPVAGLRCSPTTSPTIERTMRALLLQRGYEEASRDVLQSQLPFRG